MIFRKHLGCVKSGLHILKVLGGVGEVIYELVDARLGKDSVTFP